MYGCKKSPLIQDINLNLTTIKETRIN